MKKTLLGLLVAAMIACAAPVLIDSHAGLPVQSAAGVGTTVGITPHPAWQPNGPTNPGDPSDNSAVWISWADTGYGGAVFQPWFDSGNPLPQMIVAHTFTSGGGLLLLNVWADDTAGVYLDNNLLFAPQLGQNPPCSGQPIGCVPDDMGHIETLVAAGTHTLYFATYQTGTVGNTTENPFGLLYTGAVVATPEPATSALLGGGLLLMAGLVRRRAKNS